MRTALSLTILLAATGCHQGTLHVDPGSPSAASDARWVVEAPSDDALPTVSELGWAWDFGEFMAITNDDDAWLNYEWSMSRDADGSWIERDDLLMYYALGPRDNGEERSVAERWFDIGEAGIGSWEPDGYATLYPGPYNDLWADGEQLWAVGDGGLAVHFDGTTWTEWDTGTDADLHSVEGGAGGIWAVGAAGTVVHFDGTDWVAEPSGVAHDLTAVEVIGELDLDGEAWAWNDRRPEDVGVALGDVFAGGPGGLVLRRE